MGRCAQVKKKSEQLPSLPRASRGPEDPKAAVGASGVTLSVHLRGQRRPVLCPTIAIPGIHQHPTGPTRNKLIPSAYCMSHTQPVATSSSSFQQTFNNALKAYEERTKQDLLVHPLAAQIRACDSPNSILLVLQQQVKELYRSQSTSNDRLTKWLDPTVFILYALPPTLGEGISMVCLRSRTCEIRTLICVLQLPSPVNVIFTGVGVLLSVCVLPNAFARAVLI